MDEAHLRHSNAALYLRKALQSPNKVTKAKPLYNSKKLPLLLPADPVSSHQGYNDNPAQLDVIMDLAVAHLAKSCAFTLSLPLTHT